MLVERSEDADQVAILIIGFEVVRSKLNCSQKHKRLVLYILPKVQMTLSWY